MPIKRTSPAARPKRTAAAPRTSRARPVSRAASRVVRPRRILEKNEVAVVQPVKAPVAPIIQPNEKRGLILAHAAMRERRDPVQMLSLWAGVIATFVVVVGAWWWASKPVYVSALSQPKDTGFSDVTENAKSFTAQLSAVNSAHSKELVNDVANTAARLNALSDQVEQNQATLDRMAAMVSSTTPKADVFQAKPATTQPTN